MISSGGKLVVIDTGNGPVGKVNSKGTNGMFADNLAAAGFDAAAVDSVVISHFHTDHVNGLLKADGTPAFPNAEVLVPATEWKYWMDDGEMSRAPAGRMQGLFKNNTAISVQRELRNQQEFRANVESAEIHLSVGVREDPEIYQLIG